MTKPNASVLSLLALVVGAGALVLHACSTPESRSRTPDAGGGGGVDAGSFDRSALLGAFGECALATYRTFESNAAKLATAVDAAAADPSESEREAARAAWSDAIAAFQEAELMHFGPLAPTSAPGGKALRDPIYAWPLVSRCQIDQVIASKEYDAPGFTTAALVNVRGLGAIEYLVAHAGEDNGCAPTATLNTTGAWTAIVPELPARKAAYAKVLGADVSKLAVDLVGAWDPAKGDFFGELKNAGKGSAVFATDQDALNAVSDALFYLDKVSKDAKLATPLGLTAECTDGPCPDRVESQWAHRSVAHLRANLIGFRKLFEGCGADYAGLGFDDLLVAVGAGSVATEMKTDLVAAIGAVDAFPYASIEEGLSKDPAAVTALHTAIKKVTDALKTEFVSVLGLKLPKSAAGDAD